MIELQVGVKILLANAQGKYLLMRRSPIKYPETQKWDIPSGRIDPGSTLMDNLAREVREETGLAIIGTPRLIAAQDILKNPERHVVRLTYVGSTEGEPVLSEEHTEYGWYTVSEMTALDSLDSFVKKIIVDIS